MKINLEDLKITAKDEIEEAGDLKQLDILYRKYLGKNGEISQIFSSLDKYPKEERGKIGKKANELKKFIEETIKKRKAIFEKAEKREQEWFDITAPGKIPEVGHLHPLTLVRRKIEQAFLAIGFSIVSGPEIENEFYNFDALNIPKDHPARDLWDTLWLKDTNPRLLLRTHTSPVQIRFMEKNNPPLRIIVPGRVFRHEATDASHEINFYQVEGLMVDKNVSLANLKGVLESFMKYFFGQSCKIRWQPSFFPFVEPGLELLMGCKVCNTKGCSACKQTGWLEVIPCGMVHPNVLKAAGLNPKDWQGFAFGMGLDRLAMMKYKINDIRLFYSGDLRFLGQF
jgi:phenylalanyl-tRNA synthetase alpha chain